MNVNLSLGETVSSALNAIAESTGTDQINVIREALATYHFLVDNIQAGSKIILEHKDGKRESVTLPYENRIKNKQLNETR